MTGLKLTPLDTLFLRDSTPFTEGTASQFDVQGFFPPTPRTTTGALRVALALCNGWNYGEGWPPALRHVLGDGMEALGTLTVQGPFVLRNDEPVFPVPRHLLGLFTDEGWWPAGFLRPGTSIPSDLGHQVRLPDFPAPDVKQAPTSLWVTRQGLKQVLAGVAPPNTADFIPSEALWQFEQRVGLTRDPVTRTALEGRLYSTRHVRLRKGVSLGILVDGIPPDWSLPHGTITPLGGESRLVEWEVWSFHFDFDPPEAAIRETGNVLLVALTPVFFEEPPLGEGCLSAPWGQATLISACIDRTIRVGGWDSLNGGPLPLTGLSPAGSAFFYKLSDANLFLQSVRGGTVQLGRWTEWGFGLMAVGTWFDERDTI